jgi:citrate synthase
MRVHLRHEVFNLDAEAAILDWLATGRIQALAFNDHMRGIVLSAGVKSKKIKQMAQRAGLSDEDFMALIERVMLERKGLKPNLDWPAARVYHALGLPVKVFTPIFVVARMSGWTAHVIEQIGDNRLIRPMSIYCGAAPRDYTPLESR